MIRRNGSALLDGNDGLGVEDGPSEGQLAVRLKPLNEVEKEMSFDDECSS